MPTGLRIAIALLNLLLGAYMVVRASQIAARSPRHRHVPWRLLGGMLMLSGAVQALAAGLA